MNETRQQQAGNLVKLVLERGVAWRGLADLCGCFVEGKALWRGGRAGPAVHGGELANTRSSFLKKMN